MAAFSYQHHPFLLDSIFLPNNPNYKMSSFVEEEHINTNCFSQFHPRELPQQIAVDEKVHESSCLDHCSKVAVCDSEPSLTKKQSAESSTVVDKLDTGEQVTQKVKPTEKKRKSRNGASLTSAQSKEPTERKIKTLKKCYGSLKEEGEKKPKPEKKVPEEPPTGYIRVRARRGQATDSHSLAERVRREKISERMRMLQRLVPGCDKVTGKALMLDEIINYVQSLQNQVEFLSMKLASVNPMFYDFGMNQLDGLMVRQESLNSMASPLASLTQYCNPTQPAGFPDINTTAAFATASNYPIVHNSASLLLQHGERPNSFSLDIASIFCDAEDQRQNLLNQSGFSNNSCFFH